MKNAFDWAYCSPQPPLLGKPVAIMGASTGNFFTLRAQSHQCQILTHIAALLLGKPAVRAARAHEIFDAAGKLADVSAPGILRDLFVALAKWSV